jgi:TolA-binding protein
MDQRFSIAHRVATVPGIVAVLAVLWFGCVAAVAQEAELAPDAAALDGRRDALLAARYDAARAALSSGVAPVAGTLIEGLLAAQPDAALLEQVLQLRVELALMTGRIGMASRTIEQMDEQAFAVAPVDRALVRFFEGDSAAAMELIDGLSVTRTAVERRPWLALLRALLALREGSNELGNAHFATAQRLADNELLRAHFELVRLRHEMDASNATPERISALRETMRSLRGERSGFEAARMLAIALQQTGATDEALELLSAQLAMPGIRSFELRPGFLLLVGIIAGPASTRGDLALRQVIVENAPSAVQLQALHLLLTAAAEEPRRGRLRADLADWLGRFPEHALRPHFLFILAHLDAANGDYAAAQETAALLQTSFPEPRWTIPALELQAAIAWSRQPPAFRTAADYLNQLRQLIEDPSRRQQIGVLIADCFFLNSDFVSAAEAYAAAMRDLPAAQAGRMLFQRVTAELRSARSDRAVGLLDAAHEAGGYPMTDLWRAEWNLLQWLRRNGQVDAAFSRIAQLLGEDLTGPDLSEELHMRLHWLYARLALEHGRLGMARELAQQLRLNLTGPTFEGLPQEQLALVEAHLLLLEGEVLMQQQQPDEAAAVFAELRDRFSGSGPAILSFLVDARTRGNSTAGTDASASLLALAERFPTSDFAPLALWEAALSPGARASNEQLQRSIVILERLINDYPDHSLVFFARLKQGDLARQLNDFPSALLLYESALSQFPGHAERFRAELGRADVLMALSSDNPTRREEATVIYERNTLLPALPAVARLEAGYKWAQANRQADDLAAYRATLWLVYQRLIADPNLNAQVFAAANGRYWSGRLMLELADSFISAGDTVTARALLSEIAQWQLPGAETAMSRLLALP